MQYLRSPFTWDKVVKVLRPLPNHVKNQKLLVHILFYILFNYLGEISKTMFECENYSKSFFTELVYSHKVALSYVAVAVGKLFVACFHLGKLSCSDASLQVVVVANHVHLQVNSKLLFTSQDTIA